MSEIESHTAFAIWCRNQYDLIQEGGVWGVPRSGLIFQKKDGKLTLLAKMEASKEEAEIQEDDYQTIKDHFEAAGIPVDRREGV